MENQMITGNHGMYLIGSNDRRTSAVSLFQVADKIMQRVSGKLYMNKINNGCEGGIKMKRTGYLSLLIIGVIVGLTMIAGAFSTAYGQACDGLSLGTDHTCVLTSGGNVDCYGYNVYGQAEDYTGGDALGVSAGWAHSCVLTTGGNVDCYGWNGYGQAGDYIGGNAMGVSAGTYHSCVLTTGGNVDCYGLNSYGQAGDYTGGDALGVSSGHSHTCVLTTGGNVDCYGLNNYGQAEDYTTGDALGVSAGWSYTCVLTTGGRLHHRGCHGGLSRYISQLRAHHRRECGLLWI
jgi:hypothetical protein